MKNLGKLPPQDVELESVIIGSIIIKNDVLIDISELLTPETFYKDSNRLIYSAIVELWQDEKTIDLMTITQTLKKNNNLENCGGAFYISTLTDRVANTSNIVDHVKIIKQKEIARKQIELGHKLIDMGYNDSVDPLQTNEMLVDEAYNLNSLIETNIDKTNLELIQAVTKKIEAAATSTGLTGIETGFKETDVLFGGYQNSQLIIKAARPAMGKTAHALCESLNAAVLHDKKVLFFSLEMGAEELMQRLISSHAEIDSSKFNKGQFTDKDWELYHEKTNEINKSNLKIIDDVYTLSGIKTKCKKEVLRNGVDMVVIDYLQLVINSIKGGNREQEISSIARGFKMLAKDLKVPVVALSQLSRQVESRADKRPMLSDLRESGAIEQDADVVQFLYRPEYYGLTETEGGVSTKGKGWLLVSKNRSGGLQDIEMNWHPTITKFKDATEIETLEQYNPQSGISNNNDFEDQNEESPF